MMFKIKTLALCSLLSAGALFGFGTIAQAQEDGGQGGISGAAAFIADAEGNVTSGAVAGAVGRIHAVSQAYLGDTPAPAAYAIGTSIPSMSFSAADGVITTFSGVTILGTDETVGEPTLEGLADVITAQNGTNMTYTMYVNSLPDQNVSTSPEGVVPPAAP